MATDGSLDHTLWCNLHKILLKKDWEDCSRLKLALAGLLPVTSEKLIQECQDQKNRIKNQKKCLQVHQPEQ